MRSSNRRTRVLVSFAVVALVAASAASIACNSSSDDGSGANCSPNDDQPPIIKVYVTNTTNAAPVTATDVTFVSGTTTLAATCEDNDAADGCDGAWYVTVDPNQTTVQVSAQNFNPGSFNFLTTSDSCGASLTAYTATVALTAVQGLDGEAGVGQ